MFKRIMLAVLFTTVTFPSAFASTSENFDENTLKDYFIFDTGTWWDYVDTIDSLNTEVVPNTLTVTDDLDEATHRTTTEDCKYTNCTVYIAENDSNIYAFVAEDGQVSIRSVNGYDIAPIVTLDTDDFSGDVDDLIQLLYGINLSKNIKTSQSCDFTYDGEEEVGGYTAGVIENVCTISFDYNDDTYGSTPTLRIVARDIYMQNVGMLYEEMKFYSDNDWQYTTYRNLKDTSIPLVDLSEDNTQETTTSSDSGTDDSADQEVTTASENPFSDLRETHRNYEAILYLYGEGVIKGYEDGTFKPNQTLNRAELLKILVEGKNETPDPDTYHDCFSDVTTDWYAPYVCYAKEQGWVSGYADGTFKPGDTVNKVEALKMLLNSQGVEVGTTTDAHFSDVSADAWFAPYVAKARELGILEEEDGAFLPDGDRTRGSICENLYRLLY